MSTLAVAHPPEPTPDVPRLDGARLRRRALGQYFTPPDVAAFALGTVRDLAGAGLSLSPRIIDPACGEGVFLLAALDQDLFRLPATVGMDVDAALTPCWRSAGLDARATLRIADGLCDLPDAGIVAGSFDLVVGNPPYGRLGLSTPGDVEARLQTVLAHYHSWRLGTTWAASPVTAAPSTLTSPRRARERVERFPVELLFVERFLQLARPGGWLAIVLPDGSLASPRLQPFRDWLMQRMTPRAIIALPRSLFDGAGSHTAILVGQKAEENRLVGFGIGRWALGDGEGNRENAVQSQGTEADPVRVPLTAPSGSTARNLGDYLGEARAFVTAATASPPAVVAPSTASYPPTGARGLTTTGFFARSVVVERENILRAAPRVTELRERPWSPQYWDPEIAEVLARLETTRFHLEPLGRRDADGKDVGFLRYTTYGAVGSRAFQPAGICYLTPRNLTPTGVDRSRRPRFVAPGSRNDPPRSRLRTGDILLSNSGVASLGRPALFLGRDACNISQHLNLIRVAGIDACYVTAYLHSAFGRAQMRRLYSGTGAAGLSYDDIRAIRIPVLPPADQGTLRSAFLAMHGMHEAALQARNEDGTRDGRASEACEQALTQAGAQLAALVQALEDYIVAPDANGLTIERGSVSTSGPLRLTATVCSE